MDPGPPSGIGKAFDLAGNRALALLGRPALVPGTRYVAFTGDFGFWNRMPSPEKLAEQIAWHRALLSPFDLRIFNLEFSLPGSQGRPVDLEADRIMLDYLDALAVDAVSLANNHALAFGEEGLDHNIDHLGERGFRIIGLREHPVHTARLGETSVAVCSATDLLDQPDPNNRILRTRPEDLRMLSDLTLAADVKIAFAHLGSRSIYPSRHELGQARSLIARGADVVVATGAHFVKGFIELDGKPVLLGLGNHLLTWEGGDTEDVGFHCVVGIGGGRLTQIFLLPFHNAIYTGRVGALSAAAFDSFAADLRERSTTDTGKFFADPRTQAGALRRLKSLRLSDLRSLRWRHVSMGLRALLARLRGT